MLVGKYLAYLACTISVVLPVGRVGVVARRLHHGAARRHLLSLLQDLGIMAVGFAAYGALFALAGARLKRPLVFGLAFIFGWETLALALPG